MTDRPIEDAYFYRIDRQLIDEMRTYVASPINFHNSADTQKRKSLFDFLDEQLQPDRDWFVDISF